jgi:hypothetical protein
VLRRYRPPSKPTLQLRDTNKPYKKFTTLKTSLELSLSDGKPGVFSTAKKFRK